MGKRTGSFSVKRMFLLPFQITISLYTVLSTETSGRCGVIKALTIFFNYMTLRLTYVNLKSL